MEGEKRRYSGQDQENPAKWDPETRTLEIRGQRYTIELFEAWAADGLPNGAVFQIVKRQDGVLTLEEKSLLWHPVRKEGNS